MAKQQWVRVLVPASTANLGAGFDTLGMALGLYNEIEVERIGDGLRLEIEGEGAERLQSLGSQNLTARAVMGTLQHLEGRAGGLRVRMLNRIPLSRGLGSSSAAALGGVAAAAALAGASLSPEEMLDLALPLERHPDNITPALLGGLTVATLVEGKVRCVKLPVPDSLQAIAVIPDFRLSTAKAREALPPTVPRADAVFNVGARGAVSGRPADRSAGPAARGGERPSSPALSSAFRVGDVRGPGGGRARRSARVLPERGGADAPRTGDRRWRRRRPAHGCVLERARGRHRPGPGPADRSRRGEDRRTKIAQAAVKC